VLDHELHLSEARPGGQSRSSTLSAARGPLQWRSETRPAGLGRRHAKGCQSALKFQRRLTGRPAWRDRDLRCELTSNRLRMGVAPSATLRLGRSERGPSTPSIPDRYFAARSRNVGLTLFRRLACRHFIRNGRAASRLLAAKPANSEAARGRDAVARWLGARADGFTAEQATQAVGVSGPRCTAGVSGPRRSPAGPIRYAGQPGRLGGDQRCEWHDYGCPHRCRSPRGSTR